MVSGSPPPYGTSPADRHPEGGWRPVTRNRAHELVVDQVEEQILGGTLGVGDRLPAERDLALRLGVSRAAVREAIRGLEAQGVVRSSVGAGRDAGTVVAALPSQALTRLLRLHVALANFPMPDVVAARVMLERSSAHLAAQHASPADLAVMDAALGAMDEPAADQARFNDADTAFHVAVAEAGRNRLVADMTIAIRDSMRLPILRGLESLGDGWTVLADRLRAEHRDIRGAIATGDGELASRLVEEHILRARASLSGMDG